MTKPVYWSPLSFAQSLRVSSWVRQWTYGGFIKGILRGVRCTKSLRVLFLHRRPPSWTTLVLYSRAVFIFNEPAYRQIDKCKQNVSPYLCRKWIVHMDAKSNCQIYFLCFNVNDGKQYFIFYIWFAHTIKVSKSLYPVNNCQRKLIRVVVRHVTGTGTGLLGEIPRVVVQKSALL
jgi:hypothetical protein